LKCRILNIKIIIEIINFETKIYESATPNETVEDK